MCLGTVDSRPSLVNKVLFNVTGMAKKIKTSGSGDFTLFEIGMIVLGIVVLLVLICCCIMCINLCRAKNDDDNNCKVPIINFKNIEFKIPFSISS